MKKYQLGFTDGIAQAFVAFFAFVIIISMLSGAFLTWFIPKVWGWVKPLIHAWTS